MRPGIEEIVTEQERGFAKKWVGIGQQRGEKPQLRAWAQTQRSYRTLGMSHRCTWFSSFDGAHLCPFYITELPWCAHVWVSVRALKDSWIHLTRERKTFELTIILALLIFRHQLPSFPKNLGNCDVTQLPIFGKICRGKGNVKCLPQSWQKGSEPSHVPDLKTCGCLLLPHLKESTSGSCSLWSLQTMYMNV